MNMKLRYRLFLRRKSVYYAFDDTTKTFTSLKTKDRAEANRLLMAINEAGKQPAMNLSLARVYLRASDPMVTTRTWQNVLDEIIAIKTGPTQTRWKSAANNHSIPAHRCASKSVTNKRRVFPKPAIRKLRKAVSAFPAQHGDTISSDASFRAAHDLVKRGSVTNPQ
jgi:hypothetical protein